MKEAHLKHSAQLISFKAERTGASSMSLSMQVIYME
jgi:hypothetical protein